MAARVRAFDWSTTVLGPREQWPEALRVAVDICLNSRFPMFVWWGPELINIYNDAYVPMLGKRHPSALGRPARASWDDIWSVVGPQANAVMQHGEATWNECVKLVMERKGYWEDTYFTWSYSPIRDESRRVGGLFCAVTEETERVRAEAERDRLAAQRRLALDAARMGWWHYDPATRLATYDQRYADIFGITGQYRPNDEIFSRLHADDRPGVWAKVVAALNPTDPQPYSAEFRIIRDDGGVRWIEAHGTATFDGEGAARRAGSFVGTVVDVTERRRDEELLAAQKRAMEVVAGPAPLEEALAALTRIVSEQSEGRAVASILLLNDDGCTLRTGAAPELPVEYNAALDGIKATAGVGTCCDAAARNESVITTDIAGSPAWEGLAHLPLALGLKAAWSMPIRSSDNRVLGTFGTYFRERREPTEHERQIVEGLSRAAALAIERRRGEEALRKSEQQLRLLTDVLPALISYVGVDLRYRFNNRAYMDWFGKPPEKLAGLHLRDLLGDEFEQRKAQIETALSGEAVRFEGHMPHHERGLVLCDVLYVPDKGPDGRVRGLVILVQDITERKKAEAERDRLLANERAARAEAERASEAKSDFLATLSHELRTPLTPVLLTVSLMESNSALPADIREDVATIRRNVELESRLISDLLDLTRISKGKLQLDERDVDLHLILRSAIDICQREASAKLAIDLGAKHRTVCGDSTRLQQIFWNLINNAMKFTPPDGTIAIRSRDTVDGRVRVEVTDTGAGIDPAVLPKLFNAFEQGEVRANRQQAGLGLGLAISKKLAEAHGGTIIASSKGRGHGATFAVELPVVDELTGDAATTPYQPAEVQATGDPLHVLLVEDHEPTLRVMERLLRRIGHRVTGVTSVASATAAASQNGFDLIISDLGLPDGSGLDVMRELRPKYSGRAIALTGYGMDSDISASRDAGFAEHLTKPVDLADLDAAIRRVARSGA